MLVFFLFSRISVFITQQLTSLTFTTLLLVLNSHLGSVPKYFCDQIRLSASSLGPLLSSQRHDPLLPCSRTPIGLWLKTCRSFAYIGPSFWNSLPLIFVSLFSLLLLLYISLTSWAFFWSWNPFRVLLCGLCREKRCINIYIIQYIHCPELLKT